MCPLPLPLPPPSPFRLPPPLPLGSRETPPYPAVMSGSGAVDRSDRTAGDGSGPVFDHVWACASPADRAGDLDQVRAIAWALNPDHRTVDLAAEFERWLSAGADPGSLPDAVVGIGRTRIATAREIRRASGGRTRMIHIGRHRGAIDDLDGLVTCPAFRSPASPKVLSLPIVLSDRIRRMGGPSAPGVPPETLDAIARSSVRPGWIGVFLGAPLRIRHVDVAPSRVRALADQLDRVARASDRDLVICGAPRTVPAIYDGLASRLRCRHHLWRWTANDPLNPFEAMVRNARDSVVTADSITMISQLVAAGHRVLVFPWRRNGPVDAVLRLFQDRRRRSFKSVRFCAGLYERRLAAPLDSARGFDGVDPDPLIQDRLFAQLREFFRP